jgi:hypothetical protein
VEHNLEQIRLVELWIAAYLEQECNELKQAFTLHNFGHHRCGAQATIVRDSERFYRDDQFHKL